MAVARVQVSFARDSALPADMVTNTMYFKSTSGVATVETSASEIAAAVAAFYNTWDQNVFSEALPTTGHVIDVYDMEDAEPRVPVLSQSLTIVRAADEGLPSEVAVCLSFKGLEISGTNPARRRGRIYIGPLAVGMNDTAPTSRGDTQPNQTHLATIIAAAIANLHFTADSTAWAHSVYSPTLDGSSSLEASTTPVFTYWMDNAWDIQRRRGIKATTRITDTVE